MWDWEGMLRHELLERLVEAGDAGLLCVAVMGDHAHGDLQGLAP